MSAANRPAWQLPPGVSRGLWDYVHAPHIADDYDDYFALNSLFETDGAVWEPCEALPPDAEPSDFHPELAEEAERTRIERGIE